MKSIIQYLGKVSITCNGKWNVNREYDRLCLVHDGYFASYISKKTVPAGIVLTNEEYWQPVANLREDVSNAFKELETKVIETIADFQLKLKEARLVVANEEERDNLTIEEVAPGCEVYILETEQSWILDTINTNNEKTWHLFAESKLDSEAKQELEGIYNGLTSERAICDAYGNIIHDTYITRDAVKNYVNKTINDFLKDYNLDIPDGSIDFNDLSESLQQIVSQSGGRIVNIPDEEDLTVINQVLKFKDRAYRAGTSKGLGYKILRMNYMGQINLLEQDMITDPYTVYEVRYDYNLDEKTIELPEGAVINMLPGGTFNNGTIICNNNIFISPYMDKALDVYLKGEYSFFGSAYDCPKYDIATNTCPGLVLIGYNTEGRKYEFPVLLNETGRMFVDITSVQDYIFEDNIATDEKAGAIRLGFVHTKGKFAVQLDANDRAYVEVPIAKDSDLGTIQTGYVRTNNQFPVKVDSNGNAYAVLEVVTSDKDGLMLKTDKVEFDRINTANFAFKQTTYDGSSVTINGQHTNITNGLTESDNATIKSATSTEAGVMSAQDKTEHDRITTTNFEFGETTRDASNVIINATKKNVNDNTNPTDSAVIPAATSTNAGVMTAKDKTEFDRINTTNFTLGNPVVTDSLITIKATKTNIADGTSVANDITIPVVTSGSSGIMSPTDKANLDKLTTLISFTGDGTKYLADNGTYKTFPTKLSEFTNDKLYQTKEEVNQAIQNLINGSPAALDTLKELADALGNDPNFATTITNLIATKADKTDVGDVAGLTTTSKTVVGAINEHETQINDAASKIATAQKDISTIKQDITNINNKNNSQDQSIANLQSSVTNAQNSISSLQQQFNDFDPLPSGGTTGQVLKKTADGAAWQEDKDTTYNNATTTTAGLMSATDKAKLDGIANGANAYTLPIATESVLGGIKSVSSQQKDINGSFSNITWGVINGNFIDIGSSTSISNVWSPFDSLGLQHQIFGIDNTFTTEHNGQIKNIVYWDAIDIPNLIDIFNDNNIPADTKIVLTLNQYMWNTTDKDAPLCYLVIDDGTDSYVINTVPEWINSQKIICTYTVDSNLSEFINDRIIVNVRLCHLAVFSFTKPNSSQYGYTSKAGDCGILNINGAQTAYKDEPVTDYSTIQELFAILYPNNNHTLLYQIVYDINFPEDSTEYDSYYVEVESDGKAKVSIPKTTNNGDNNESGPNTSQNILYNVFEPMTYESSAGGFTLEKTRDNTKSIQFSIIAVIHILDANYELSSFMIRGYVYVPVIGSIDPIIEGTIDFGSSIRVKKGTNITIIAPSLQYNISTNKLILKISDIDEAQVVVVSYNTLVGL